MYSKLFRKKLFQNEKFEILLGPAIIRRVMEKVCFDCGMKDQTWTGPVFSSGVKLREFYQNLGVTDTVVDKMQDSDLLCSKCAIKAECRHALKCYEYYKEKWTPEQYEIWAKNNTKLISIAEDELKELERAGSDDYIAGQTAYTQPKIRINTEKLAIIEGNPKEQGEIDSSGQAIINSELAKKFEEFCAAHKGKIIDWNTAQSNSGNWLIFLRYTD